MLKTYIEIAFGSQVQGILEEGKISQHFCQPTFHQLHRLSQSISFTANGVFPEPPSCKGLLIFLPMQKYFVKVFTTRIIFKPFFKKVCDAGDRTWGPVQAKQVLYH